MGLFCSFLPGVLLGFNVFSEVSVLKPPLETGLNGRKWSFLSSPGVKRRGFIWEGNLACFSCFEQKWHKEAFTPLLDVPRGLF